VERKRLAGLTALANSRSPPGSGIYTTEINAQTYARLLDCTRAALLAGESIVVDAAFLRRHERAQFSALARELNAGFTIVHCDAPVAVLAARIRERVQQANDASEATADLLPRQQTYWESFTPEEVRHVIEIDTARGAEAAFAAIGIETR
jgi:predicted kinase